MGKENMRSYSGYITLGTLRVCYPPNFTCEPIEDKGLKSSLITASCVCVCVCARAYKYICISARECVCAHAHTSTYIQFNLYTASSLIGRLKSLKHPGTSNMTQREREKREVHSKLDWQTRRHNEWQTLCNSGSLCNPLK